MRSSNRPAAISPVGAAEVEIAEPVAMADAAVTLAIMKELRERGFGIVLDDFGTGFSSLEFLRRFPIEAIKIDGSYVGGVNRERSVVAEGVEERGQLDVLLAAGCDRVQGYVFSPALPPAALERWLARHTAVFAAG